MSHFGSCRVRLERLGVWSNEGRSDVTLLRGVGGAVVEGIGARGMGVGLVDAGAGCGLSSIGGVLSKTDGNGDLG